MSCFFMPKLWSLKGDLKTVYIYRVLMCILMPWSLFDSLCKCFPLWWPVKFFVHLWKVEIIDSKQYQGCQCILSLCEVISSRVNGIAEGIAVSKLFRWLQAQPSGDQFFHNIENNQMTCSENELTGFCTMETFVLYGGKTNFSFSFSEEQYIISPLGKRSLKHLFCHIIGPILDLCWVRLSKVIQSSGV